MRKQDQLLNLIKSLSATEKKYFSQQTAVRKDSKSYLALYEELQKADTYDADVLSKKLKKTKQNIAHEKEHLQSVLLKTLRNYEGDKNIDTRLYDALINANLLNHKGQHDMALAIVRSAQKEAEQYERWGVLWSLLKAESTMLNGTHIPRPERIRLQEENLVRMKYATSQMQLLNEFEDLFVQMDVIFLKGTYVKKKNDATAVDGFLKNPLMSARYKHVLPQRYQAIMYSSIYIHLRDFDQALPYYKKLLDMADQYPEHIRFTLKEYFVALNLYVVVLALTGKVDEAYKFIQVLKTKSLAHIHHNAQGAADLVLQYTILQELFLGRKTDNARRGMDAVERLKTNYKKFMEIPTLSERSAALLNAAKICFYADKPGDAIYWLEKIFNDTDPSSQLEAHNTGRMLFAICHVELKSYSLLPYLVKSTERFLKKHNGYNEVEKATLTLIKKLPSYRDAKERKQGFSNLLEEYERIKHDQTKPNGLAYLNYFQWAEKHLKA
jgi:hypothetical protein